MHHFINFNIFLLNSVGKFFEGTSLLIITLIFFTVFSYYMPKGRKAMSGLSGAVCATFLIEVFNFWVLGNIPIIGNFTKIIGSFAGLLAAPGCAILVIILMGGNPIYALLTGTSVFAIGLSIDGQAIYNAIAKTLINTNTELGKKAINDQITILAIVEWIKNHQLNDTLNAAFNKVKSVLLINQKSEIIATIFNNDNISKLATNLKSTIGMFNILSGLVAGYTMYWILKLIEKYAPAGLDLLLSLIIAAPLAAGLALVGGNLIAPLLGKIGQTIETATNMTPIPMAIVIGGFLTIVGTSPLSSMALAVAIQLQGSAMAVGSIAAMGSSFMNGMLFAKMKYGDNKTTIACAIEPLSQADLISLNPISVYVTNFIGGATTGLLTVIYGINILNIEQLLFMQNSGTMVIISGFSQQGLGLATPFGPVAMFGQGQAQTALALTSNSTQYTTGQLQMHLGFLLIYTAITNLGVGLLGGYIFRHSPRVTIFEIEQRSLPIAHQYLKKEIAFYQSNKYHLVIVWYLKIKISKYQNWLRTYIYYPIKLFFNNINLYLNDYHKEKEKILNTNNEKNKKDYQQQIKIKKHFLKNQWINSFKENLIQVKEDYFIFKTNNEKRLLNLKTKILTSKKQRKLFKQHQKYQNQYLNLKKDYKQKLQIIKNEYYQNIKAKTTVNKLELKHNYKMSYYQLYADYRTKLQKIKPLFTYLI